METVLVRSGRHGTKEVPLTQPEYCYHTRSMVPLGSHLRHDLDQSLSADRHCIRTRFRTYTREERVYYQKGETGGS